MKKKLLSFLLASVFSILGVYSWAGDIQVNQFGGLDTQDPSPTLQPFQSQDLLNVLLTPGGSGVYKRDGYGLFASLPIACSTCAVHGGYHFQQVGGNDVQLWGNDTELASSVSDGAFVKVATGTVGATWQCADSQGFAYCLTSSHDTCVRTDGSSANTTFQGSVPLGTMVTFTPLQMVVAGVSGTPSTLYVSAQNAFTNFTTGPNNQDPFTIGIAAPGSRFTHIAYYFGKLFWWKDQSFGFVQFSNQYDAQVIIVSNQVGTLDNSDAYWNSGGYDTGNHFSGATNASNGETQGGIYFRGQDNHIYRFDGYFLTRVSRIIAPTVTSAGRQKSNAWIQSSQSDFQNGSITTNGPSNGLSTTISPGAVIVSSFGVTENSSAQWNLGSTSNLTVNASSISLSTDNSANITDNGFENSSIGVNWTSGNVAPINSDTSLAFNNCTVNPDSGSRYAGFGGTTGGSEWPLLAQIVSPDGGSIYSQVSVAYASNSCSWASHTLSSSGIKNRIVKLKFVDSTTGAYFISKSTFILNGDIVFKTASDSSGIASQNFFIDSITGGVSSIQSGVFTSQVFDSGFSTSTYQLQSSFSTTSQASFGLQTSSSSSGPWLTVLNSTGTNVASRRYAKYFATLQVTPADSVNPYITSVSIISQSTGTFYSSVDNAPNIVTWASFNVTDTIPGNSSISYFTRSSTNVFTVTSSTPAWISQSKNGTVAVSTGTYFQARADFSITAATETPTLSDFAFNWFEGGATDKAYMTYFNDAIWISVSSGTSTGNNNRILYYDLLNQQWLLHDIASQGFLIENNNLYFGDPVQGRIFKYGGVPTDNSAAINSYWKSKDFLGQNPYVQNEFTLVDFVLGAASPTSLTYTYTLDQKTSTSISLNLVDSASAYIRRAQLLAVGKIGSYYNFKIGDNSSNPPWKLLGHHVQYTPLNWKPVP